MAGRRDSGSALVVALWVMTAAALAAAAIIAVARPPQYLTRNAARQLEGDLMLQKGVYAVVQAMLFGEPGWREVGAFRQISVDGAVLRVLVQDEAGKVDLGVATPEILSALVADVVAAPGPRASLVDAIQDWRDADSDRRLNGAEAADYSAVGRGYLPRNRSFVNPAELQRVFGMDALLYRRLAGFVTVYSQKTGVDMYLATPQLRRLLPGGDAATAGVAHQRAGVAAQDRNDVSLAGRTVSIFVGFVRAHEPFAWKAVIRFTGRPTSPFEIMGWERGDANETFPAG